MCTTLDLDPEVLEELKRRSAAEGKPIGAIASELLRQALGWYDLAWASQSLEIRVDLEDKDARLARPRRPVITTLDTNVRDRDLRRFDAITVRDPFDDRYATGFPRR